MMILFVWQPLAGLIYIHSYKQISISPRDNTKKLQSTTTPK